MNLKNCALPTDLFVKPAGRYQFLDPFSCHPYHFKKGVPYSQTLRLNRICSDHNNSDKRCKELESWLLEKGYSEKMVRKQLLRAREHSRESLLKKVKSESDQNKLSLNITCYPVFNSQKVVYLLKCRICREAPYVGKAKAKFRARFRYYKNAHRSHRKKTSSITAMFS